jgi:hypothetical protein
MSGPPRPSALAQHSGKSELGSTRATTTPAYASSSAPRQWAIRPLGSASGPPPSGISAWPNALDTAGVPKDRRILAALGPRALQLAAARTSGTHPYLVLPDHTRDARQLLGPGVIIAPEHKVVLTADAAVARRIGRRFLALSARSSCTAASTMSQRACTPTWTPEPTTSPSKSSVPTPKTHSLPTANWPNA